MLIIDCFNHNIYLGNDLIGYIGENELFIRGKKFADISDRGDITLNGKQIGYIDDDGEIYVNGRDVGFIDANNNFVFERL